MNTTMTVVAMETVHHDYRSTFVQFNKTSMMTLHLIVNHAIFTKLCMSKVQYVGVKHMTSYKYLTSFRRKVVISFSEFV